MRGKTESGVGAELPEVRRLRERSEIKTGRIQAPGVLEVPVSVQPEREASRQTEEIIVIAGRRYRVIYDTYGPYIRSDGKGVIEGVRFTGVVPA